MPKYQSKSHRRKSRSVMNHTFSRVPTVDIPRSVFNRNHTYKTTFDSGYLVPIYVDEALPGDTFNCKAHLFGRLATPIVPIMDNLVMDTFFFAVPLRLVWDNFQKFMGEQDNPEDSTDYLVPIVNNVTHAWAGPQSLWDYFGLPVPQSGNAFYTGNNPVSALFFRAYNLIWNEWFRDQNLQDSVNVRKDDGPDSMEQYRLLKRGKRHDYFTSALPWPQKGPGVELPLGESAPVQFVDPGGLSQDPGFITLSTGDPVSTGSAVGINSYPTASLQPNAIAVHGTSESIAYDPSGTLEADLSNATAATINSLRQAFQLQRMMERDARGGTRYTEIIQSHFRVRSPDARLQRPEYLGGGSVPVNIMPVPQTASTDATTPQGNLAGFGTVGGNRSGFSKSFTEHSIIIGLVNVRADLTYQQGVPRMFSRRTKYDFYWPALAHLGEQTITNREIFYDFTASASDNKANGDVFGYQERWAEYRYFPSRITGRFRSDDAASLDIWHLSQDFADLPVLSADFIEENPPVERVIAVPSEPQFLLDVFFDLRTARPMPTYSVPGLIDHF